MNAHKLREIFTRFKAANPHPTTELEYSSPFELLIAVILSAQATDKGVNLATRKLFPKANTPEKILALGEAGLRDYIKSIGLYKTKAKNILATCAMLVQHYGGAGSAGREQLEKLPGVGRKTANVMLNTAFGEPTIAVDTHIFRVSNRTGIARGKTVLEVESETPRMYCGGISARCSPLAYFAWALCMRSQETEMPCCIINDLCEYEEKTPSLLSNSSAAFYLNHPGFEYYSFGYSPLNV